MAKIGGMDAYACRLSSGRFVDCRFFYFVVADFSGYSQLDDLLVNYYQVHICISCGCGTLTGVL